MGHSSNYFELEKGFFWPDNSKLLANAFSLQTKKRIAGVLCVLAAICFFLSGICVLIGHPWHKQITIAAVITSTVLFVAFWDGGRRRLHTQGGVAILINTLIFVFTLK
jgi:hypothetical protein